MPLGLCLIAIGLVACFLLVTPPCAKGDIGIVKAGPAAGQPGDLVEVTVGCGFCYGPCPARDVTCNISTATRGPAAWPILLVPNRVPLTPHRCGPDALCPPASLGLPRRSPFIYLGLASRRIVPYDDESRARYRLRFRIPALKPGLYKFVIYCGVCSEGAQGSLIAEGDLRRGLLRVRPADPLAATHRGGSGVPRWLGGTAFGMILLVAGLAYWRRPGARRSVRARSTSR
jgi:hypothetical protein